MSSELLFNIDNLITPHRQSILDSCRSLADKIDELFKLTEFTSCLSPEEIDEINNYYLSRTGERYTEVFLSEDDKELVKEYAACYPNFGEIKHIINGLCYNDTYDECVTVAQAKINDYRLQQEEEASDYAKEIHTALQFDDDISKQSTQTLKASNHLPTLTRLLAEAQQMANEINSKR